jgi:hypothetical protein
LHPADEQPFDGKQWKHKSKMLSLRKQANKENLTFSFMFRVVQKNVWVNKSDSRMNTDKHPIKANVLAHFSNPDSQEIFNSPHYKQTRLDLDKKIETILEKYHRPYM